MEDWSLDPTDQHMNAESRGMGLRALYEEEDRKLGSAVEASERAFFLGEWLEVQAAIGKLRG